jgi:hypothetical protein
MKIVKWFIILCFILFGLYCFGFVPAIFVCRADSSRPPVEYCKGVLEGKYKSEFSLCDLYESKDQRSKDKEIFLSHCRGIVKNYDDQSQN